MLRTTGVHCAIIIIGICKRNETRILKMPFVLTIMLVIIINQSCLSLYMIFDTTSIFIIISGDQENTSPIVIQFYLNCTFFS